MHAHLARLWRTFTQARRPAGRRRRPDFDVLEARDTPAVTAADGTAFALSIDAADNVTVFNNAGSIAWTVNSTPNTGATPSNTITSITVTATGAFANTIDLSALNKTDFPALNQITINAGDGDDSIVGSRLGQAIDAGAGNDSVQLGSGNGSEALTLTAQNGALVINRLTPALQHTVSGAETVSFDAGGGDDTFTLTNLAGLPGLASLQLDGGAGNDTVVGPDITSAWHLLTAINLFTSSFGATISNTENIVGGSADDTFRPFDTFGVAGKIDGGAGIDHLDYGFDSMPVVANLATGSATGIAGGVANIENLSGGSGADNLTGDGLRNVIHGGRGDDILSGGGGDDSFVWHDGDGNDTIDAGAGNDLVELVGSDNAETYNLAASGASLVVTRTAADTSRLTITGGETLNIFANSGDDTLVVGNLAGVASLATVTFTGGFGSDTIVGPDLATTWNLTGTGSGNLVSSGGFTGTLTFSAENLTGGAGADVFRLDAACQVPGKIDGGAGSDTIDYSAFGGTPVVNLAQGTATNVLHGIASIETVTGVDLNHVVGPDGSKLTPNQPPVNQVPRRLSVRTGATIALRLRITDSDAGSGRLRVTLSAPGGKFRLDLTLLRRIRGLKFRGVGSKSITLTGTLAAVNKALRIVAFVAPNRPGKLALTMLTTELDAGKVSITDRDVVRVQVHA